MNWGLWLKKTLIYAAIAVLPVLIVSLSQLQTDPLLPSWAGYVLAAVLVGLKSLENWLKHRND